MPKETPEKPARKGENSSRKGSKKKADATKRPWMRLLWTLASMALLTFVLVVAAYLALAFYTHHGEVLRVPNVTGIDAGLAIRKLEAIGLAPEVSDTGYVETKAPNEVLFQDLEAGRTVKVGRKIMLTVNSGTARSVVLPDIVDNASAREAKDKLQVLGFRVSHVEYVDGEPDWVYGVKQNGRTVSAGSRLSTKAPLTLIVGKGLEQEFDGNDSLYYELNEEFFEDEDVSLPDVSEPAPREEDSERLFD